MKETQIKAPVCVLDASSYVGFWILKGLLNKGYSVHAAIQLNNNIGEMNIENKIKEMEKENEKLVVYGVDVFDYQSILIALKGCSALFCCFDSADGYDDMKMVDMEVRGVINVVEASAQTESVEKIVFTSSLTAAIWKDNISKQVDVDETSWSNLDFCRKFKLWHALAKTEAEQAAWALAMDRKVKMISINAGLVLGPNVTHHNPCSSISYLKGAAQMYENGVLAYVEVEFLVDVHIRAMEDESTCGRYFCFNQTVNNDQQALQLAQSLAPLISFPPRYEQEGNDVHAERLRAKKLNKLIESTA
ncbi:NAD(P)-binding Rossmann-fold superfamily protein [Euphorbia peplus]|nr:NAD(P)-binding Rossmann-fold superfamily protein [Euphorbia peplus]